MAPWGCPAEAAWTGSCVSHCHIPSDPERPKCTHLSGSLCCQSPPWNYYICFCYLPFSTKAELHFSQHLTNYVLMTYFWNNITIFTKIRLTRAWWRRCHYHVTYRWTENVTKIINIYIDNWNTGLKNGTTATWTSDNTDRKRAAARGMRTFEDLLLNTHGLPKNKYLNM